MVFEKDDSARGHILHEVPTVLIDTGIPTDCNEATKVKCGNRSSLRKGYNGLMT